MMTRCYSPKYHEKEPTYKECNVCDRWLCFANFLEDLPLIEGYQLWNNNPGSGVSLDKDMKIKNNKTYSIETCIFVSRKDNVIEGNQRNKSKAILMLNLETKEEIRLDKIKDAFIYLGCGKEGYGHIRKCINGDKESYMGYAFKITDVAITD